MKMLGSDWKRLFCLLLTQSLMIVFASSFLVIWGIELIGDRMDFSLPGLTMTFPPETLLKHILQYIVFLALLCMAVCLLVSVRIRRSSIQTGIYGCLLYTSPRPRDGATSRMPSSA